MSSKIDERIVKMEIDHDKFQKGVADTNKALEALKKALNIGDAGKNLDSLDKTAKNFNLSNIANGVDAIMSKFGALSIIGITALTNIANRAIDTGLTLMRSLTVDPIKAGFDEYELKMGSIQTILANTARYGTSLETVTTELDKLNEYADKTIYNFGDMTRNIGLFTNAGIKVEDATSMIKGFSNEAAASGTNSQAAAGAAYQLSQALSAGTIRLMDWRSLTNAGMGNKNMQNGLIEIANAMGTLEANTITAEEVQGDFNGSLEKNWLSADVMSTYLRIMAGDMDAASMSALGLSDAQIQAFQQQATTAEEAATKVRTWTQLIGTLQEGVGSAWAQTFDILIGDFNQATDLFTKVNDTLGPIISASGEARNALLQSWADLGGRDAAIAAVSNAFQALMNILKPVQQAFRDIFPPMTGEQLMAITVAVRDFTASLIPSEATMAKIQRTFKGVFAVLDIGRMVIVQVVSLFGRLFSQATQGAGGILDFTASLGDWLVSVRDAIKNGDGLVKFFEGLEKAIKVPIDLLRKLGQVTMDIVSVEDWAAAWEKFANAARKVGEFLAPVMNWIGEKFQEIKKTVAEAWEQMDPSIVVGLFNTGLLAIIAVGLKKIVGAIKGMFDGIGGGILETIKGSFEALTGTMEAMQQKLKSETLIKIAIAIGLLTASVVALSFIDTGKLFTVLGAMAIMFTQLMAAMIVMEKATASKGFLKMPVLAATLIGMATAMTIFSAAVLIMSTMDWNELARGMAGMAVGLGLMVGSLALLSKMPATMIIGAMAMTTLATGLVILAAALKIMSTMSWDDIGRSMTVLAGGLAALAVGAKLIQGSVFGAAAMILVATAVTVLSGAMKIFATMSWDDIGRSLVVLAGSLAILVIAMKFMEGSLVGAAAMVVVSAGIVILAGAFKIFATMSWDDIGRTLVILAGGLAILAGAMALMGIPLVMAGSIGILASAAAMMMLAPALKILGSMSWDDIGRGLTMLAASLVILAAGGVLLLPAIPAFIVLGSTALAIGIGAMAAGVGLVLMAAGLTALAGAAALGAEGIKMAVMTLIGLIPAAMAAFAQGLIDFAVVIANGGAQFTAAMTTLMMSLIDSINQTAPAIIDTLFMLLTMMVDKITTSLPLFVDAGLRMVTGILQGIANNIGNVVTAATNVIVNFINGISNNLPRVIQAGVNLIISFVEGLASAIRQNTERMSRAGGDLAAAIIDGMASGISKGVGRVVQAAKDMANSVFNAAKKALGINSPSKRFFEVGEFSDEGLADGIFARLKLVEQAGTAMGETALNATSEAIKRMSDMTTLDVNMNPTITPVLDLSSLQRGARQIGGMFTGPQLSLDHNYAMAQSFADAYRQNNSESENDSNSNSNGGSRQINVIINQTNNSPKAISQADLYRSTKNAFSVAKGAISSVSK